MPVSTVKNFNLPWNQHEHYWVGIYPKSGSLPDSLASQLASAGLSDNGDGILRRQMPREWKTVWENIRFALEKAGALDSVEIALTHSEELGNAERKAASVIDAIAESLWIGEALLEDRLVCYLQPVVSAREQVFGYESFARVVTPDGGVIGGDKIIAASKALGIKHVVDRHLHVQAVKTFATSAFNGFLFVNFFPGFIHRPAVYLEGLSDAARSAGIVSKHIVLDFTKSETPRDLAHLKSVCEYGRSQGHSVALDDIESVEIARKLVGEIRPDFVKIDMTLVRNSADAATRAVISEIVMLVHAAGGTVIAEGVETEQMYQQIKALDVDLFQGYYFSPPMPVEAALKRSAS